MVGKMHLEASVCQLEIKFTSEKYDLMQEKWITVALTLCNIILYLCDVLMMHYLLISLLLYLVLLTE